MTVLETEKSAVPSVQASMDRYITPEYLAHLPTSVSYTIHISDGAKNHDFMTLCQFVKRVCLQLSCHFTPEPLSDTSHCAPVTAQI